MKFTGHERDFGDSEVSDLDYMHARYYQPWAGRFLEVDPAKQSFRLGEPQSWNRYIYGGNDPMATVDPDGRVLFKLVKSGAKFAIKGGDLAATFAGVIEDFNTLRSDEATGGEKALAAVSRPLIGATRFLGRVRWACLRQDFCSWPW